MYQSIEVTPYVVNVVESIKQSMDTNQLGRRNLSPINFKLALGRRYNRSKKANGERGAEKLDQNEPAFTSTAAKLATQHSVSFTGRTRQQCRNAHRGHCDAVVGGAGIPPCKESRLLHSGKK